MAVFTRYMVEWILVADGEPIRAHSSHVLPDRDSALIDGRFDQRVELVAREARLQKRRLLQWILAWFGLSAAWIPETGEAPDIDTDIGRLAADALAHG